MAKIDQKTIKTKRRIRVVEYWALGATLQETTRYMREEGYRISPTTVHRDRHSTTAKEYIDELIRRQLRDIATAELEQKLNYRDKLISKLVPQKIEAFQLQKIEQHVKIDVSEDEDNILNRAASILDKRLSEKKQPTKIH